MLRQRKKKEEEPESEANNTEILDDASQFGLFTLHEPTEDSLTDRSFPVDIIALHGLNGTPYKTWTHTTENPQTGEKKDVLWLKDFLPQEFPGCRVYTYGYNAKTKFSRGTGNIESFARELLELVIDKKSTMQEMRRPIVFVAHSMGGLVVKKALIVAILNQNRYGNVLSSTAAILFLATPHRGSKGVSIAGALATLASGSLTTTAVGRFTGGVRADLIKGLRRDDSTVTDIANDFSSLTDGRIRFYSFVEDLTLKGLTRPVVDQISSRMNIAAEVVIHMAGENHRSIACFSSSKSSSYLKVLAKLKEAVNAAITPVIRTNEAEDRPCLQTLAFPSMDHRKTECNKSHLDTCTWILTHPSFTTWLNAPSNSSSETSSAKSMLWIKGHPGTGKSTLMAFIYRYLVAQSTSSTIRLDFFFTRRGEVLQKNLLGMYRSLLHQIYVQSGTARELIYTAYFEKKARLRYGEDFLWEENELRGLLTNVVKEVATKREITLFIDALDEAVLSDGSKAAMSLTDYLSSLNNIVVPEDGDVGGVRVCISCRHYPVPGSLGLGLEIKLEDYNTPDIHRYTTCKLLSGVADWSSEPDALKTQLIDAIVLKAAGVFQWVVLRIPKIVKSLNDGEMTLEEVRRVVDSESNELFTLYATIFKQDIAVRAREKALVFLRWVALAVVPLSLSELRFAMACDGDFDEGCCEIGNRKFVSGDGQMAKLVKSLSGGLAEVWYREDISRVQFVHETVDDFLRQGGLAWVAQPSTLLQISENGLDEILGRAQDILTKSCLNYLRIPPVFNAAKAWMARDEAAPIFINYAVRYMFIHAQHAERHGASQAALGALLQSDGNRWVLEFWGEVCFKLYNVRSKTARLRNSDGMLLYIWSHELIHIASVFNISTIIRPILAQADVVGKRDLGSNTPLHLAAQRGHIELCKILLHSGADPNAKNGNIDTPLKLAADGQHQEIAKMLLERGADVNEEAGYSGDALQAAAKKGNLALLTMLLDAGADVNVQQSQMGNALQSACQIRDNSTTVKLLLNRGAEINAQGGMYGSALQAAIVSMDQRIIKLLLDHGADIHVRGGWHESVLQAAVCMPDCFHLVDYLLRHGADVRVEGGVYGTVLQAAVGEGNEEVIQLLLDYGADVNAHTGEVGSALISAASCGLETIVRLLLGSGARTHSAGGPYENVLQAAVMSGNKVLVQFLLDYGVDVNIPGGVYGSPLQAAVINRPDLVALLLDRGADVNTKGKEYGCPLYAAVAFNREVIVKILLEKGAEMNCELQEDISVQYPYVLHKAASGGHLNIVKMLLEHGVNVNAEGGWSFMPSGYRESALSLAARNGHKTIVELLLDHGATLEPYQGSYSGALAAAAERGHIGILDILLKKDAEANPSDGARAIAFKVRGDERQAPIYY